MPRKGLFHVSSMPSIRMFHRDKSSHHFPMRSCEVENLQTYVNSTTPNDSTMDFTMNAGVSWSPIVITSDPDADRKEAKVESQPQDSHDNPVELQKQLSMLSLRDQQLRDRAMSSNARLVHKEGDRNIATINLPEKSVKFFKDFVNTLVDAQWRWVIAFFLFSYFGSWLLFAVLFYIIGWSHGDFDFDGETGQRLGDGLEECTRGAVNLMGFFLLSVEQQVSTGYGERYPTEECPEAIFLLIAQLTIGVVVDATMVGIMYVKLIRPIKYANFKFSKKAVICQRDGKLYLIFRVADFKQDHSIDSKIRAYLFEEKITAEGERAGKSQKRIKIEENGRLFLIWPQTVCHLIDKTSPFYNMSAEDLLERRFELVVCLTGISRHTGQMTQVKTSYLSKEVLWGHRFVNVIAYDYRDETYVAYVDKLDDVEQVDTALGSAQRLYELKGEIHDALENETMNNLVVGEIDDFEEDEDDYKDDFSGFEMQPLDAPLCSKKFNVTKIDERDNKENY